jgi:hypothetical protein
MDGDRHRMPGHNLRSRNLRRDCGDLSRPGLVGESAFWRGFGAVVYVIAVCVGSAMLGWWVGSGLMSWAGR